MKKTQRIFYVLLACLLLFGCTATYRTQSSDLQDERQKKKLAVLLPLTNLTSYPNAGKIVGDILATELYARANFKILERTEMTEKLQSEAKDKDVDVVIDNASALKLAANLGAEIVIYGSVSEYRYKRGLDEEPAIGINLRLLDVSAKRVLWAGSVSATSNCFFMCRDSLNLLAHEKCTELVSDMLKETGDKIAAP